MGDGGIRQESGGRLGGPTVRLVFHDLHNVAVRIFDVEVLIAGLSLAHGALVGNHLDTPRLQVCVHLVGIVGIKRDMVELVSDKGSVGKGQTGNKNFNVKDPDGHIVEIVEYQPDSWTAKAAGKFLPDTRISDHIMHLGVLVGDLDKSNRFYGEILGFKEFWRGSGSPRMLSWVNMRPAEADDYLEFMLYNSIPEPDARGTKNHASLTVPDADKALAELKKRAVAVGYDREIAIQTGVNRKRQINLYDPDGTRIELMEPNTIDGQPAPNSTAPPPRPVHAK